MKPQKEKPEEVIRVNEKETRTVRFVTGLSGKSAEYVYTYSVGKTIFDCDVPKLKSNGSMAFDCWCSDDTFLVPKDPKGHTVTEDVTFYASWYDSTVNYGADAAALIDKDGGVYHLPRGKVIFYGASNFTRFTTLPSVMAPELDALNHGFGGSSDPSMLGHLFRLVIRYQPSMVVIQCSNNGVNASVNIADNLAQKKRYEQEIHKYLPDCKVVFVSFMPLPGKPELWQTSDVLKNLNAAVKAYCGERENTYFLDVFDAIYEMSLPTVLGETTLYFDETGHYSAKGKEIFGNAMKPALIAIANGEGESQKRLTAQHRPVSLPEPWKNPAEN